MWVLVFPEALAHLLPPIILTATLRVGSGLPVEELTFLEDD